MNTEDMVLWHDYESGEPVWISKETYNRIMEMRAAFMARIQKKLAESGKKSGSVQIVSMSDPNGSAERLWEEYSKAKQDLSSALGISESKTGSGMVRYFTPTYPLKTDEYGNYSPDPNPNP